MKKTAIRMAAIGAVAALIATAAPFAQAATTPAYDPTTDAPIYLMDGGTALNIPAGTQMDWSPGNGAIVTAVPATATSTEADFRQPTPPAGSGDYIAFISPVGSERTKSTWKSWGDSNAFVSGQGALEASLWPGYLGNGAPAAVKAGGTFSMGIAYMTTNDLVVAKAYYTTINVDAGGAWTFSAPATKTATTTALTASATAIAASDPVTLTATVSPASATGNVTFNEGSIVLGTSASAAGVATLTTSALAVGAHAITATYAGDSAFNASTSSAVTVTVQGLTGPDSSLLVAGNAFPAPYNAPTLSGTVATLSLPASLNGKKVNVFGYSSPTFLAQVTISGGSLQVNVASFSAGTHQIAIVDATNGTILGWVTVTITNAAQTATRDLQAVIATSIDGTFALVGPDNTTPAVIGNPTLDTITGESVSTGTLGAFAVKDDRSISKKGWTLTADVNNFVNGATSIDKKALGIAPVLVSNSGPGLPVLGTATVAGSAVYAMQFAQLAAGTYSTTTNLNANLTFRAPLGTPAGTYTSTLTLTLVSL